MSCLKIFNNFNIDLNIFNNRTTILEFKEAHTLLVSNQLTPKLSFSRKWQIPFGYATSYLGPESMTTEIGKINP